MRRLHASLVAPLIACLITAGCQIDPPAQTIVEYRPATSAVEKKAPDSEVFVLWQWLPVSSASTRPTTQPVKQHPVVVQQVYAERGTSVGFRRSNSALIAVAGSTTIPLDEAHYTWKTYPGSSARNENRRARIDRVLFIAGTTVVVVVIVAAVLLAVHEDRHSLWDDVFNSN